MSVAAKTPVTVVTGSRGYPEYDRHYSSQRMSSMNTSDSGRRIDIQDLIINEPVRSLPSVNTLSTEQYHLNRRSSHNQFSQYSLSPTQLPLPHSHHTDLYKLPTPMTSPT